MAINSFFRNSMISLCMIRSVRFDGSISRGRFLMAAPFSTATDSDNIFSAIRSIFNSSEPDSNVISNPTSYPFEKVRVNKANTYLRRELKGETAEVVLLGDTLKMTDGNPKISINAYLRCSEVLMKFEGTAEHEMISIHIHSFQMRDKNCSYSNLGNFEDFLRCREMNPTTLSKCFSKQRKVHINTPESYLPKVCASISSAEMATNSVFRSSLIPLSMIRSVGFNKSIGVGSISPGRFLTAARFIHNHAALLESRSDGSEPAASNMITEETEADLSPFVIARDTIESYALLRRKYQNEDIFIDICRSLSEEDRLPVYVDVSINRGKQQLYFHVRAKPDNLEVIYIAMRNRDGEHLENFEEYLGSKGIKSNLINSLFDRFGIKRKNQAKE